MQRGGLAVGDGSWNLAVFVTDLQVERTLRVRGDVHIGGLMIRLVDELGRKHAHARRRTCYVTRTSLVSSWDMP